MNPKALYKRRRKFLLATGQWDPWGDLEAVRAHIMRLRAQGVGARRTAELAGLSQSTVFHVLNCATRVQRRTAELILAVNAEPLPNAKVPAVGTRRRVRALQALGYSSTALARSSGVARNVIARLSSPASKDLVAAATADRIARAYRELSMCPAPDSRSARIVRAWARKQGWLPPLAWEEELIDLPEGELAAELERRVAAMDDAEVARCYRARREGDPSLLIHAGAQELKRRKRQRAKERKEHRDHHQNRPR